jgi:hypothetical protein
MREMHCNLQFVTEQAMPARVYFRFASMIAEIEHSGNSTGNYLSMDKKIAPA